MVKPLVGEEANLIKGFGDELFFAPVDVPIIIFSLLIGSVE